MCVWHLHGGGRKHLSNGRVLLITVAARLRDHLGDPRWTIARTKSNVVRDETEEFHIRVNSIPRVSSVTINLQV
jgi:hypothetical protein